MQISLFTRDPFKGRNRAGKPKLAFNPYVQIGGYELCVDRHGACIHTPRRSFGFIRGSGFWSRSA